MDYSNEIFDPNHINAQNIIFESYYDMDSDASSSSYSSNSSNDSEKSASSTQSTLSQRKAIPWVEAQRFSDLQIADSYVVGVTSTRDSTKPLCLFFDKLTTLKHKMLQQTRICRTKLCKDSGLACDFKMKYQKCETCQQAVVFEAGEHVVEQTAESDKRGIDEMLLSSANL
jgi:hypothetical protein